MTARPRTRRPGTAMSAPLPRRSRLTVQDLVSESLAAILARPSRTALTVLGTVLGIAAVVATLGLARTAGSQIVGRFDALEATSITVENARPQGSFGLGDLTVSAIPWDAEARLRRLRGVVAAATVTRVDIGAARTRTVPITDPTGRSDIAVDVVAASPGVFDTVGATLTTGRVFDSGHRRRSDPVTVLGPNAARRLRITRVDQQPAIFVGDTTLAVIGILADVSREPSLLDAIIVPDTTARALFQLRAPTRVDIRTELGAAQLIGEQAAIALAPDEPSRLRVAVPPDPRGLQTAVEGDVNDLFLVLGGVALLVGSIGIANVTLVSVLERTGEIGLRRAVGAARRHIAAQFLAESAALGLIGGIVGSSVGILVVAAVSASRQWTPVLDLRIVLVAPLIGATTGVVAGLYPSWRAATLEPVDALRSGT